MNERAAAKRDPAALTLHLVGVGKMQHSSLARRMTLIAISDRHLASG